jgi:hypothetical protein
LWRVEILPGRVGLVRRLLSVHFVPSALFVAHVWVLVRAGSFTGSSHWGAVPPSAPTGWIGLLAGAAVSAGVLALLLRPFQVRAVRVLEGYWDRWRVTARLADVLTEVQRRRWVALRSRADRLPDDEARARVAADAGRRLAARPPSGFLLPTALGNALRAGEITAGERYGLTTLASWPRIYMQISPRMLRTVRSTRDSLDLAVNLCWSFLASAVLSVIALYDEPSALWLPVVALASAAMAYKGAVTAAQAYAGLMHVVYDLHRFDLLDALHYAPPDKERERELFEQVSAGFLGEWVAEPPYSHPQRTASGVADGDGATDAE